MAKEMAEQPAIIAGLLSRRATTVTEIQGAIPSPLHGVALVGRGSSEHAALFGRYLLEVVSGRPATVVPPTLVPHERPGSPYGGYLAIGISQSGETPEIAAALAALAHAGATTLAVTARPDSPMADGADLVFDIGTDIEEAVPATKTFTASLVALLLVAAALGPAGWPAGELDGLPDALAGVLADRGRPDAVAGSLAEAEGWACVGEGLLRPIAQEAALKLEEAALVVADHHSTGSFRHGPIATAGPRRPVVAFATGTGDATARLAEDMSRRGSPVVLASPAPEADLPLPALTEPLLACVAAVRAQQLALALATHRHLDPDHPPGLTKVTRA